MKRWRTIGLVMGVLFLWGRIPMIGTQAQTISQEPVISETDLDVDIMCSTDMVRSGEKVPISVRVTAGEQGVQGSMAVYVPVSDGDYYVLERELSVEAGETKQVVISVPVHYGDLRVLAEYRGQGKEVYAREWLQLSPDYYGREIYVGVLSDHLEDMMILDRVTLNEYQGTSTRMFDFKRDTLPEEAEALTNYDILLWDGVLAEDVKETQLSALDTWVYHGGIMLIGNDSDLCKEVESGHIRQENWGRGQYIYCGFSLRQAARTLNGEADPSAFLRQVIGEERIQLIQENMEYGYNDYWNMQKLTVNVDPVRIPDPWMYAVVLVIYLVLLGPVLYHVLKRKKRQHLLRGSMIGLALVFTGIIYIMGSRTRFMRPWMNYASIQEVRDGIVMENVYASVYASDPGTYDFAIGKGYRVTPIQYNESRQASVDLAKGQCLLYVDEQTAQAQVTVNSNVAFSSQMLHLSRNEINARATGVEGDLCLFDGAFGGLLTNETGCDLQCAFVLAGRQFGYIGEWSVGETVDLSQVTAQPMPSYRQEALLAQATRADQYTSVGESAQAAQAAWRNQVAAYYVEQVMLGQPEDGVLIAFPREESHDILTEGNMDLQGITLMAFSVPVCYEKEDMVYGSVLSLTTEVLQGTYDPSNSSMYSRVTVLRYGLGEIEPEVLRANWQKEAESNRYRKAFHGTMEFYNHKSQLYDVIEQKDFYTAAELQDYLDEENVLTVRFQEEPVGEYNYEVLLPEWSVVGRRIR